jgi:hypothetical protein
MNSTSINICHRSCVSAFPYNDWIGLRTMALPWHTEVSYSMIIFVLKGNKQSSLIIFMSMIHARWYIISLSPSLQPFHLILYLPLFIPFYHFYSFSNIAISIFISTSFLLSISVCWVYATHSHQCLSQFAGDASRFIARLPLELQRHTSIDQVQSALKQATAASTGSPIRYNDSSIPLLCLYFIHCDVSPIKSIAINLNCNISGCDGSISALLDKCLSSCGGLFSSHGD